MMQQQLLASIWSTAWAHVQKEVCSGFARHRAALFLNKEGSVRSNWFRISRTILMYFSHTDEPQWHCHYPVLGFLGRQWIRQTEMCTGLEYVRWSREWEIPMSWWKSNPSHYLLHDKSSHLHHYCNLTIQVTAQYREEHLHIWHNKITYTAWQCDVTQTSSSQLQKETEHNQGIYNKVVSNALLAEEAHSMFLQQNVLALCYDLC